VLAPASFFDVFVTFNVPVNCQPMTDVVTFSAAPAAPAGCYTPVTCTTTIYCDQATPTMLSNFVARMGDGGVTITWASDAVDQISGWNVDRGTSETGPWTQLTAAAIPMGSGGRFEFKDPVTGSGDYFYRLKAVMTAGGEEVMSHIRVSTGAAAFDFSISGKNPFVGRTTLHYTLPRAEHVTVNAFTVTGQMVRTLVDRAETPGTHSVDFDLNSGGRTLAPGIYMIRISAGQNTRTLQVSAIQ
jgi:hypothetical protein